MLNGMSRWIARDELRQSAEAIGQTFMVYLRSVPESHLLVFHIESAILRV
jgi:hypothetical protein